MNYSYSAKNNAFYSNELKSEYQQSETWDTDAVVVSDEIFYQFSDIPPKGKVRAAGNDGLPAWVDIPHPTHEELIAIAELEKQRLINQANEYINNKQWPGKAAIGRIKSDEMTQYNLWLDYLDTLEAVDTVSAPNIEWPIQIFDSI